MAVQISNVRPSSKKPWKSWRSKACDHNIGGEIVIACWRWILKGKSFHKLAPKTQTWSPILKSSPSVPARLVSSVVSNSLSVSCSVVTHFLPPMDCSPPGSSIHRNLQARILEWVAILFQGIFPTQGWNPGLWHCRQILYHLSHKGGTPL